VCDNGEYDQSELAEQRLSNKKQHSLTHSHTPPKSLIYPLFIINKKQKKTYAFGAISPSSYDCCSVVGDDVFIMMQTYYPPINSCRSIRLSLSPSLLNITQTKVADTECIVVETHHKQTCTYLNSSGSSPSVI